MLNTDEILSTVRMLHDEHLDVRAVTLALNHNVLKEKPCNEKMSTWGGGGAIDKKGLAAMPPNLSSVSVSKRIALLLFLVSAFSFVYLKHCVVNPNSANRVALCLALLDGGTVCIDKYYHLSDDICVRDGHYYCDKAPGVSFLALPFVATAYYGLQAIGRTDFTSFDPAALTKYPNANFRFLTVVGSLPVSLLCAVAISTFYALAVRLGASQRVAVLMALLLGFGTPFGTWSTVMFGHAIAGAFLLFATASGLRLLSSHRPADHRFAWVMTGLLLAYAVWIEYTAAVPSIILGCVFIATMIRQRSSMRSIFTVIAFLAVGALPIAAGFCYYNTLAFGGPFTTGYQFVATNFPKMDEGFCGIKIPQFDVLVQTLVSLKHGILWFSPILILSPLFALRNIIRDDERFLNIACILIPLYYFLLNSSYVYWKETCIPCRHVTVALPFLFLPLVFGWGVLATSVRLLVAAFAVYGCVICFAAINVPLSDALWTAENKPLFLLQEFANGRVRNLLCIVGLNSYLSLGILLTVWTGFGVLLVGAVRSNERSLHSTEKE